MSNSTLEWPDGAGQPPVAWVLHLKPSVASLGLDLKCSAYCLQMAPRALWLCWAGLGRLWWGGGVWGGGGTPSQDGSREFDTPPPPGPPPRGPRKMEMWGPFAPPGPPGPPPGGGGEYTYIRVSAATGPGGAV